ncbi:MAG: lysylphosphatidylglycerol synthase transmembrane domain-containing protein [Anaerolineae bacterium]|nr:flippase-like domain-containing protein [Caldilineales bacterium]MCX7852229.1 flippase-like domain-containing protein [Caldilineales bacterium]MDW8270006.1 lysylphosphatidylglycerol synthase transmembrane domain-containing protein [Anaerolineae bacterium]
MARPRVFSLLLWVLALLALFLVVRQAPPAAIWAVWRRLTVEQITALIAANAAVLVLLTGRWWSILRGQGYRIGYHRPFGYRLAAFAVSYLTPGPQFGGEPLQVYLLHRREALPLTAATATVALDRLLELVVNFSFLILGTGVVIGLGVAGPSATALLFGLALALLSLPLAYLLMLARGRQPLARVLATLTRRWSHGYRLATLMAEVENQAGRFCRQHPGHLLLALGVSLGAWAAMVAEYWLAARFLGVSLGPAQTVAALTAARFAYLLPMPGGLGAFEAGQLLALTALGFGPAEAMALALLIRGRDLVTAALGIWLGRRYLDDGR